MKRLLPLLLLCLGCATVDPYERGAYRPPARAPTRAPTTNPTTDAPRYAPPGHMPTPGLYPRGPYTRVLPSTRETGIWAGDEPKASGAVVVKGVPIPLPDETPTPDLERARACAQGAGATLDLPHSDLGSVLKGKSPPVADMRNCTAFLAWHRCMTSKMWPLAARPGNERLATHAWEHFKKDPNRCHKWANARAESLALFEADLLSWFHGNYGSRQ